MRRARRLRACVIGLFALASLPAQAVDTAGTAPAPGYSAAVMHAGYLIAISVDPAEPGDEGSYDVTMSSGDDVFLRYTAARHGRVVGSAVADLADDGSFEIVVWTDGAGADAAGQVYVIEWRAAERALVRVELAPLDADMARRYHGGDRYSVANDTLLRDIEVLDPDAGEAGIEHLKLRYDFAEKRWKKVKRFLLF